MSKSNSPGTVQLTQKG